jgi:hypothetical protein
MEIAFFLKQGFEKDLGESIKKEKKRISNIVQII